MKKLAFILFINLITITLSWLLFYEFSSSIIAPIGIIFIGIILSVAVVQYENSNDTVLKELYTDFDKEYEDNLISKLDEFMIKFENKKNLKLTSGQKKIARDYLELKLKESRIS